MATTGNPLGLARFEDRTGSSQEGGRVRCEARDAVTDRRVRLVTAAGAQADALEADLALLAPVTHPALVPVLAHGREGGRVWAAQPLLDPAAPEDDPARIASRTRELAGALGALAAAGVGVEEIPAAAVRAAGERVLLDPLALALRPPDPRAAARALGGYLAAEPGAAQGELAALASAARTGAFATPEALAGALPRPDRRGPRRLVVGAALVAVAAAGTVGVVLLAGGGGTSGEPAARPTPPTPAPAAPPGGEPAAAAPAPAAVASAAGTVTLPAPAASLVARGDTVWAGTASGGVLPVADGGRAPGAVAPVTGGGSGPVALAVALDRVWALEPSTLTVADAGPRPVDGSRWLRLGGGRPDGLAAAGTTAWVLDGRRLVRVDLSDPPRMAGIVTLPFDGTAVAALPDRAIVVAAGGRAVSVTGSGAVTPGRAGGSAGALTASSGAVWVADPAGRRVWRLAPGRPRPVVRGARLPGRPVSVAADGGRVWAVVVPGPAGARAGLVAVDARTGRAAGAAVPLRAAGPVAAAGGTVWVAAGRRLLRFRAGG